MRVASESFFDWRRSHAKQVNGKKKVGKKNEKWENGMDVTDANHIRFDGCGGLIMPIPTCGGM